MAYLSETELQSLGLKYVGHNVRISEKVAIYSPELISIGDNCRIDDFTVLSGNISLGRNVHIALFCNLSGGIEGIAMEDFSGLSYSVNVLTQSDDFSGTYLTNPTVPSEYTNVKHGAVRIGRHVVVGANSVILPGVEISDGCAIGAMTMVTRTTEPWGIYAGIPAKKIKERQRDLLDLERQYLGSERK